MMVEVLLIASASREALFISQTTQEAGYEVDDKAEHVSEDGQEESENVDIFDCTGISRNRATKRKA